MKIGFDFDRVLFDTDSFNKFYKDKVEGLKHVDASPYDEKGNYDPEIHAELCGIDREKPYEIFNHNLSRFLYNDIDEVKRLKKNHKVIIVTRGNEKFQRNKLESSGVLKHFEDYFIVQEKSKDAANIDYLIDDTEAEINNADIPGFLFNRDKHNISDAIEEVENFET